MVPLNRTGMFTLLLYLSAVVAASTFQDQEQAIRVLERRQATCPASNPVSCAAVDPKLPTDYCCTAGTVCLSIDASSSALCCPSAGACNAIQPINCQVSLQDPTRNNGPIFTSRLQDSLPSCGNACCPFGYTCSQRDGGAFCQLDMSRAILPSGASLLSTLTATRNPTPAPTAESTLGPLSSTTVSDSSSSAGTLTSTSNSNLVTSAGFSTASSSSSVSQTISSGTLSTSAGSASRSPSATASATSRSPQSQSSDSSPFDTSSTLSVSSSSTDSSSQITSTSSIASGQTSATTTTSATVRTSGAESSQPQASTKSSSFPPGVFFAGFIPGILIGALAVLGWVVLSGRLASPNEGGSNGRSSSSSMYGKRPEIADPYAASTSTRRSDMIRKTIGDTAKSLFSKKETPQGTPGLPFDNAETGWKDLTPPKDHDVPINALGSQIPAGPNAQMPLTPDYPRPMNYGSEPAGGSRSAPLSGGTTGYARPNSSQARELTRRDTMYTQTDDPTGDIINSYNHEPMPRPMSAVPVRGVNSRQRSQDSGWEEYDLGTKPTVNNMYGPSPYGGITSTPYSNNVSPTGPAKVGEGGKKPRPETTFTDMLRAINFPDPVKGEGDIPAMPAIPKEYR